MTCAEFINPLDLQCIFVNVLSGSWKIFGIIALLGIAILGARMRMITFTIGAAILVFAVMFAGELPWIFWAAILFYAIFITAIIARMFTR